MTSVLLPEAVYLVRGLSCLTGSSNETNETDQRNQIDQIPWHTLRNLGL